MQRDRTGRIQLNLSYLVAADVVWALNQIDLEGMNPRRAKRLILWELRAELQRLLKERNEEHQTSTKSTTSHSNEKAKTQKRKSKRGRRGREAGTADDFDNLPF